MDDWKRKCTMANLPKQTQDAIRKAKKEYIGEQMVLSGGGGLMNEVELVTLKNLRVTNYGEDECVVQATVERGDGTIFNPYLKNYSLGTPLPYLKGLPNRRYYIPFVSSNPKEAEKEWMQWRRETLKKLKRKQH